MWIRLNKAIVCCFFAVEKPVTIPSDVIGDPSKVAGEVGVRMRAGAAAGATRGVAAGVGRCRCLISLSKCFKSRLMARSSGTSCRSDTCPAASLAVMAS